MTKDEKELLRLSALYFNMMRPDPIEKVRKQVKRLEKKTGRSTKCVWRKDHWIAKLTGE
jgi:hypothetical protein